VARSASSNFEEHHYCTDEQTQSRNDSQSNLVLTFPIQRIHLAAPALQGRSDKLRTQSSAAADPSHTARALSGYIWRLIIPSMFPLMTYDPHKDYGDNKDYGDGAFNVNVIPFAPSARQGADRLRDAAPSANTQIR
jgi:hypothetical protein